MKQFFALAALALAAAGAQAHTEVFTTVLNGASEAPPNGSPGIGTATVTLDLDLVTMTVEIEFSGLLGNVSASHIHCCTLDPGVSTAIVATPTPTFPGFPSGVTEGTYSHTFDMTLASSYNAAFITANGGTVGTALNALVLGMEQGKAYWNVHTNLVPTGEIRGFLVSAVPEPATWASMALGLAVLGGLARRRASA